MGGPLPAEATFLEAAEGRHLVGDEAFVDANDPAFERLAHAPDTADIARVEVGCQTERRIVGHAHHVFLLFEAEQRCDGAEGFLARNQHVGRDIGENGGLEEIAAQRMPLAA